MEPNWKERFFQLLRNFFRRNAKRSVHQPEEPKLRVPEQENQNCSANDFQSQSVLISTDNNSAAFICFEDKDKAVVDKWGQDLLQDCDSLHPGTVHVVDTFQDIGSIPSCRVALVFLDPDERAMIIEDERYHIGSGLRRKTVQRLLDSKVEVFIIIFHDKNSEALPADQLYNTRLGQIDVHEQLKKFRSEKRIVSINNSFAPWQKDHLLYFLNTISTSP